MCFDAVREGSNLWLPQLESHEQNYPTHDIRVGDCSIRLEDFAPLLI